MLWEELSVPQKWFEKLIEGAIRPTWAQAILPPQFCPGHPFELVQVILRPLQRFYGLAQPAGVGRAGGAKLLPDLPDALPATTHFVSQLEILLRPVHFGPLGEESFAPESAA